MADKFKFGISKEDREKQEAERLRQLEHEVQERNLEKTAKLQQLNKKKRTNTIIVITIFSILFIAFLVFGTYNTFFKQPLSEEQVIDIAKKQVPATFNANGVTGFIYNNLNDTFKANVKLDEALEYYELDMSSLRVTKIIPADETLADVEFLVDIETKYKDTTQKDAEGATVTVPGKKEKDTWSFRALISNVNGYAFASSLSYRIEQIPPPRETTAISDLLLFDGVPVKDDAETAAAKTSVDGILKLLYEGNDVSERWLIERIPDTSDTYLGITSFILYDGTNKSGYNCECSYLIKSKEGLTYTTTTYLYLTNDGAWKIEKFF